MLDFEGLKVVLSLEQKATKSINSLIPKVDGKYVSDYTRNYRVDMAGPEADPTYARTYIVILFDSMSYHWSNQDFHKFVDICTTIIEWYPPLSGDNPIPGFMETLTLFKRAEANNIIGDYDTALNDIRCSGASFRLQLMKNQGHNTEAEKRMPLKLKAEKMLTETIIPDTLEILVRKKMKEKAPRPYFTTKEINKYEKELGIGIYCEDHYKCHHCCVSRSESHLILCSACERAWVCSQECHASGWVKHRKVCRAKWRQRCCQIYPEHEATMSAMVNEADGVLVQADGWGMFNVICIDTKSDDGGFFDAWTDRKVAFKERKGGLDIQRAHRGAQVLKNEVDYFKYFKPKN
jgi:hypothetical protein